MALTESGRLTNAALELTEAVRLDPQHPEYRVLQANVFARLKQRPHVDEALEPLQKAGATEKLDASWLWLLVDSYYRVERFDDTLKTLDLMEKRFPDDPRLDLNRGQVYSLQSKFDLALNAFRKSVAKHPDNALAHFELGKLLVSKRRHPRAQELHCLKRFGLRRTIRSIFRSSVQFFWLLKSVDEAIVYLERAAALDPNSLEINYSLGQAWQRKGERQKAAVFIGKFQELKQREEQAGELERLLARGERLLDEGKDREARAVFVQVVEADPGNWTAHAYLAEMLLGGSDWQQAGPHLSKMEVARR